MRKQDSIFFNIFHFTTQKWIFIKFPFKCRSTSKILIFDLRPVLSITGSIDLLVKFSVFQGKNQISTHKKEQPKFHFSYIKTQTGFRVSNYPVCACRYLFLGPGPDRDHIIYRVTLLVQVHYSTGLTPKISVKLIDFRNQEIFLLKINKSINR